MVSSQHSQTLSEFGQNARETIDRLNKTGEAETLTVDGEARAVLLSPAAYEELAKEAMAERDAASIRRSLQQLREGKGRDVNVFLDEVRAQLLAMKAQQQADTVK